MELVIGISGASGVIYGVRLLEALENKVETHLIVSEAAQKIIGIETDRSIDEIRGMASHTYDNRDFTAPIASGSTLFDGMIIAPCSMKTLGCIANGIANTLMVRVAEVCLKEARNLVLMPRETPLSTVHLSNMAAVSTAGAIVLPACPAFYTRPKTVEDMVDFMVGRALDLVGVEHSLYDRWGEISPEK